jgi:peptidoglycan/xylan/chitin deacetylase (PgdA/CDA1 family)
MADDGRCEFHSHTHSHTRWDKTIPDRQERNAALASDLAQSRQTLVARLGGASDHLCWPQGYFDDDYLATAGEQGFRHCYTTVKGVVTPRGDPLRIPRIVAKEAPAAWLGKRLGLFTTPLLGYIYTVLRND